jgi:hypothetical protein
MAQKNYPMVVPQGATYTRTFTVTIDGVPWNFTGYSAAMMVRESFDSIEPVLSLTNFDGLTIDDAGAITVTIPADVTDALAAGSYVYDLEVTAPDETVTLLLPTAPFTVTPGVTRG